MTAAKWRGALFGLIRSYVLFEAMVKRGLMLDRGTEQIMKMKAGYRQTH
jgi:hypothetical protein